MKLTSIKRSAKKSESELRYPCLRERDCGAVVFFSSLHEGVIIQEGSGQYDLGYTGMPWCATGSVFRPFSGSVTITSEDS